MESIYVSQKDMLEICQDGDKYFLRYPTFNITCPEVIREIPKEAADSYMSGEHTGKELMNYAQYGFWKSKKEGYLRSVKEVKQKSTKEVAL